MKTMHISWFIQENDLELATPASRCNLEFRPSPFFPFIALTWVELGSVSGQESAGKNQAQLGGGDDSVTVDGVEWLI